MARTFLGAAMALALFVSTDAAAQANRTSPQQAVAQSIAPPKDFASCQASGAPENTFYGPRTVYTNCVGAGLEGDYGSVFVRFKPPSRTDFQGVDGPRRRGIVRALKNFFLPDRKSASLVLTLALQRQGGDSSGAPAEVPIAVIPLASFSYDENGGLRFSEASATMSNVVGYRFRIAPGDQVSARVRVLYGKGTSSNIVGTAATLSKPLATIGVMGSIADSAVQPLRDIEKAITDQTITDTRSDKSLTMTFESNGFSGLQVPIRMEPDRANDGLLFIALRRQSSLFSAANVESNTIKFRVSGYGHNSFEPFTTTYYGDKTIAQSIQTALGAATYINLAESNPSKFLVACNALWERVNGFNVNTADKAAIMWAMFLSSTGDNADLKAIRDTDCIASRASEFETYGLPLPPVAVVLSDEYLGIRKQAEDAAALGQTGSEAARKARDSARGFASRAKLVPAGAGTVHVQNDRYDYFGEDYGQAGPAQRRFLGVHRFLAGAAKEEYAGEFGVNGPQVMREGNGVLVYDRESRQGEKGLGRLQFQGAFVADSPNGFGELDYLDGSVFFGQLTADQPSGLGKLILPDGSTRVGYFQDGKLHGRGIETAKDGKVRYGLWANGVLVAAGQ